MNLQLIEKVVIVTGGAKGVGKGIVKLLAHEGAIPVIVGRNEDDNLALVNKLHTEGKQAWQVTAELTRPEECEKAVKAVLEKFGRIEGLINNAGENDNVGLESGNYAKFIESLHKNIIHYYLMAHYALPALKQSKGSIVNISSKTADTGQGNTSAYAASNGGRNSLTREWAVELAKYSIRVNAVVVSECYTPLYEKWIKTLPNPEATLKMLTDVVPFEQRFTTAEEIANTTLFLLSSLSSHTTGQLVYVDGGYVHLDRAMSFADNN